MADFKLEKQTWTDADFEEMGWHDATVRALGFDDEAHRLLIDLDYIFEWIHPKEEEYFEFWTAPTVMIFAQVSSLSVSFTQDENFLLSGIAVQDLYREPGALSQDLHKYRFELFQGEFSFESSGYRMVVTGDAIRNSSQSLSMEERNGFGHFRAAVSELE